MSNKSFSPIKTRSCTKRAQEIEGNGSHKQDLDVPTMGGGSNPRSETNRSKTSDVCEVMNELIKLQEEETALEVSAAETKAAAEIARVKAEAEAAAEIARVKTEAKRKELELKKRLMEERLSKMSSKTSTRISTISRNSVSSLQQPLPTNKSVDIWMQEVTKATQDDQVQPWGNKSMNSHIHNDPTDAVQEDQLQPWTNQSMNMIAKHCYDAQDEQIKPWVNSVNNLKSRRPEMGFPEQCEQCSQGHRDVRYEKPRDKKTMACLPTVEGKDLSASEARHNCQKTGARVLSGLPNFSGDFEQWPAWIAEFRRSTEFNDYTDLENLQRLQKSLTGKAKDIVSALLIYPENMPEIINLLERRFGRPEVIIKSLIASVRSRPPTKDYKPDTLVTFSDMVRNLVVTVKSLKQKHYLYNPQLLEELTEKLSTNMKLNWGMFVTSQQSEVSKPIGLDSFSAWLSSVAEAATVCAPSLTSPNVSYYKSSTRNETGQRNFVLLHEDGRKVSTAKQCLCCKKDGHGLADCKDFHKIDVQKRWELVRKSKVCFNCLKIGHRATQCRKKVYCGLNGCSYYHNRLLHNTNGPKQRNECSKPQQSSLETEHIGYQDESLDRVLLRVLPVTLVGSKGKKVNTFALIDDGSTISVIEKSLANELNLDGPTIPISYSWTDGSTCTEIESKTISVTVENDEGEQLILDNVKTLKELHLPTQSMSVNQMKTKWPHLQKLPEKAFSRGRPRLLIGHEHIHFTVPTKVVIGPVNAPIALKSKLGWTIDGPTRKEKYQGRDDQELIMFKSEMKDLKSRFRDESKIVKEILKEKGFEVEVSTNFEEFATVVGEGRRSANTCGNFKLTYNALLEKAEAKEKERLKEENQRLHKLESAFRALLRDLDVDSSWDDLRDKLADHEAFHVIGIESERLRSFKENQHETEEASDHHHSRSKKSKKNKKQKKRSRSRSGGSDSDTDRTHLRSNKKRHHSKSDPESSDSDHKRKSKRKKSKKRRGWSRKTTGKLK